jgi:hypothetical protein
MTKRNAAVHATSALLLQFGFRKVFVELVPIAQSFQRRAILRQLALKFHESGWLAHVSYCSYRAKKSSTATLSLPARHARLSDTQTFAS